MSTDEQLAAFIARQRLLLSKERDEEINRSSLLLTNCGTKLLERKGLALTGLGVVDVKIGLGGKILVDLERPLAHHATSIFPPHTFRPGDVARIEEHNVSSSASRKSAKAKNKDTSHVKNAKAVEGVVYKVSDSRIVIAVDPSDSGSDDVDLPDRCCILKLANSVTYDRMEAAMDQLEKIVIPATRSSENDKLPQGMTPLVQVLLGISTVSEKISIGDLKFFDDSLNDSQKKAVTLCLESPEVACIHGPPGTGKTHTLIEIIRQLVTVTSHNAKPQRLLVCGASNLSVDNILERLLALPSGDKGEAPLRATRIGHPARVMANESVLEATLEVKSGRSEQAALAKDVKNELEETLGLLSGKGKRVKGKPPRGMERRKLWDDVKALRKEYRQREGGVMKAVLGESQIVLTTCHTAGGKQLRNYDFDVVIIDEATQALEAVCWIPIFKAKKLILAGDPMQLPPTVLSSGKHNKQKAAQSGVSVVPGKANQQIKQPPKTTEENTDQPVPQSPTKSSSESSDSEDDRNNTSEAKVVTTRKDKPRISIRPPRTLETTLFERLEKMYGPRIKCMLDVQYRMHAQICEFPSKTLYSSKLKPHLSVATHLLRDLPNASQSDSEEDTKDLLGTPVIFYDTAGCEYFERLDGDSDEGSRCNENEAAVVKVWVEKLAESGILPSQIAVITPYQAQVTVLTSILRPAYGPRLEIGTVDGMQGREKDAIVISLVRSNDKREVGFLKDKRRLNVAMTRAKRSLCIVGDSSTVRHGSPFLRKWMEWLEANADVRYAGLE